MRHIAISGELGSGKSAVAVALAEALGAEVVSTGAIHRQIAASRGESALETNLAAESDEEIDRRIDGELVRRGEQDAPIVFDSRMAWHFVPGALKVHLVVDPAVGAARMLGRSPTDVERYTSVEEATARAEDRHGSEHRRFLAKYTVDIDRLRNYDVVVDTSAATVAQVVDRLRRLVDTPPTDPPLLCLSPRRLLPTVPAPDDDEAPDTEPPAVAYHRPWFWVVRGHGTVSAALRADAPLLDAALVAERAEPVDGGVPAGEALRGVDPAAVRAWEDAHDVRFVATPAHVGWRDGPAGS